MKHNLSGGQYRLKVAFYVHCFALAEELYRASEPEKTTSNMTDSRRRRLYGAIIFLAIALEAFINDFGAEKLPNDFERIEKIATPDKWMIIPKLFSKHLFSKDKQPFQSIVEIFQYRNLFIHFKPKFKNYRDKDYQKMRRVTHKLVKRFYNNTVKAMSIIKKDFNLLNLDWLDKKNL